jgi:hypothetical protein
MTIAIAWIRRLRDCEELLFVTDSRLSGDGRNFDSTPKVMKLSRNDCAIAFAGYTGHAYPMLLQLSLAIESYAPAKRGTLTLEALRKHALQVFNGMAESIKSSDKLSVPQDTSPEANFLFGGYSWVKKEFEIWSIEYSASERKFIAHPAKLASYFDNSPQIGYRSNSNRRIKESDHLIGKIAFAGDQAPLAKKLLSSKMMSIKDKKLSDLKFDMEPFEVVRDMLRDPAHSETIGGAPQLVKVYQYMRSATLGVYWPNKSKGTPHLHGRAYLGYEKLDNWVLDPDTLLSESLMHSNKIDASSEDEELSRINQDFA